MHWRIYYSDGSTFSSEDGAWEDAPGWDAQVMLFRDPETKWAMRHGGDFFRLEGDGTIVQMDWVGLLDWVVNELGIVKVGRMLTRHQFDGVYQQAKRDMAELKASDGPTVS